MNKIEYWRTYYSYSQRKLAMKAHISQTELNYIENDRRCPNVYIAMDLARALNVSVEKLFGGNGQ